MIDIAKSMPDGGVALMENWDFVSPWMYLHFEENYRPDVILLDKELMRTILVYRFYQTQISRYRTRDRNRNSRNSCVGWSHLSGINRLTRR